MLALETKRLGYYSSNFNYTPNIICISDMGCLLGSSLEYASGGKKVLLALEGLYGSAARKLKIILAIIEMGLRNFIIANFIVEVVYL